MLPWVMQVLVQKIKQGRKGCRAVQPGEFVRHVPDSKKGSCDSVGASSVKLM